VTVSDPPATKHKATLWVLDSLKKTMVLMTSLTSHGGDMAG
jgi:hypothetical protein